MLTDISGSAGAWTDNGACGSNMQIIDIAKAQPAETPTLKAQSTSVNSRFFRL